MKLPFISCENLTFCVTHNLNRFFYELGFRVAVHPWRTIGLSFLVMALTSLGFLRFHYEQNALVTFVDANDSFTINTNWLLNRTTEFVREEVLILQAENVLTAQVLTQAATLTKMVMELTHQNTTWDDFCFKIPNIYPYTQDDYDGLINTTSLYVPVLNMDPSFFCQIYERLDRVCLQDNLLALWSLEADTIEALTTEEILTALNRTRISPLNGQVVDFVHLLGGVERNVSGHIVAAQTLMINFYVNNSLVEAKADGVFNIFGNREQVSGKIRDWEGSFNQKMESVKVDMKTKHNITLNYSAARSFFDASDTMWIDSIIRLGYGFIIMFIYLQFVLMKRNCLEIRFYVGFSGLVSVGMALISGFGIGSLFGYTASNTLISIPFLVVGLGVDDMFVIMSTLTKVRRKHQNLSLHEIMAHTMCHSGTSITITSLTNVVVFLVGVNSPIPSLNAYYITAAPCILMTYFYVVTFFVAIVALDEQRIANRGHFLVPCCASHKAEAKQSDDSAEGGELKRSLAVETLEYLYKHIILTKVGMITALIPVVLITTNCALHVPDIKRTFEVTKLIHRNTFNHDFLKQQIKFYPQASYQAMAVMGRLNYSEDLSKIYHMATQLENATHLLDDVRAWPTAFHKFMATYHGKDIGTETLTDSEFKLRLYQFLFTDSGSQYQTNFKFDTPLQCGQPAPDIDTSKITFFFHQLPEAEENVPAKATIEGIVRDAHLETGEAKSFVWSRVFYYWLSTSIIDSEVFRNLSFGWISVTICTFLMIANLQMCVWIQVCVFLTMTNVLGFMSRWGINYDYLSLVGLQMSVGLCVDYAVHIGHTFMTIDHPDKRERALRSVLEIGTAVFHGGISTLLMFGIGASVNSYVTRVLLKCFVLVIGFGLYHGMVVLPILLSWFGPAPYATKPQVDKEVKEKQEDVMITRF